MKPENIKYVFDCYLKEKDCATNYDVVDGVSWNPKRVPQHLEALSGESGRMQDDRCNDLIYLIPESSSPYPPQHAPLDPHQERMARNFGRQLSNMSDEFDMERAARRRHSSSDGNEYFEFQGRCLFTSRSKDTVKIEIVRSGSCKKASNVAWKTKDKTAHAGVHYVGAQGDVLFHEKDERKTIEIGLLQNQEKDICFLVELSVSDGTEIGSINPITVNITDHENLYDDERLVVENIIESRQPSIHNVATCLMDKVTVNTFKTALMYMCSNANSIPQEFVYAFELMRIALPVAKKESLLRVVCNYFQQAPELDEMELQEESDDDSDKD